MNDIKYLKIPNHCPECGAETYIDRSGKSEILMCSNPDCPAVLLGKWATFVSKKGMDINGLSEATLEKFLQLGFLDHVFESKLICPKFKTFEEFRDACNNRFHFDTIPGIGPILNANIHKWWANNDWQMEDVAREVRFKKEEVMNKPEGNYPLAGKTFVVTGSVYHFKNRNELQAKIESLGGKVVGSVSKNTSYLINNDTESSSSKNKKAKELGVPIISEENFLKIIN